MRWKVRIFSPNQKIKAAHRALVVLVASLGVIWLIQTQYFVSGDLHNNLWGPAYLLLRGQSPYHTSVLPQPDNVPWLPAVWLPMAIGLFFPLGWLTQYQATNLWFIGNITMLLIILWLAGGMKRPPLGLFAVSVMSVFLFPPVLSHLMLGQFTVIAVLMLLLAAQNPRYLLAAFSVAVSLAKPQLTILVIPGLLLVYNRDNGAKAVMSFVGTTILWVILLTIPLWVAYPLWFGDFIVALRQNVDWAHPSLFTLLQVQWGTLGLLLWGLLAVGVFGANLWLWLNRPSEEAVIWSLALTPLINPYIWSWDFTMLVPLMIHAAFRLESKMARVLLGCGYILCWSLMVWIRFNTDNSDHRFWWVPWLVVACVCSGYIVSAQPLYGRKLFERIKGK